jgi:hypothetical protein
MQQMNPRGLMGCNLTAVSVEILGGAGRAKDTFNGMHERLSVVQYPT